jgi:hypothetical protein
MSLFTERVSEGRAFVHANCDVIASGLTYLDGSVAMEKNKIQNKQGSMTSIKWMCARKLWKWMMKSS